MATKVVKTLKFPNSTDEYQINAVRLDGKTASEINTHNSHSIVSGTKADGSTNIVGTSSSGNLTLGDSGVTAGEYGPTANQTPAYGATFNVPDIKVNSKGIVTSVVNRTVKIPASDNSEQTLTVANKSNTDTTDLVYTVTNIVESGTKGHTLTPTYTGLPTKSYVDTKISNLKPSDLGLSQALKFVGTTTTALTDGATTSPIKINSANHTPATGDVVIVSGTDQEFVWTGAAWEELGDASSHSKIGHTHTVTHKPAGTVSKPTFSGTGTLIKGTFNGTEQTASVSYTPAGSVSTPTITVTPNTTTVNSITAVGTLPSLTKTDYAVDDITAWSAGSGSFTATISSTSATTPNKVVTLAHGHTAPSLSYTARTVTQITAWSAGTLPTKGSNTTVVTGIKSATATQPTFTGTAATISHKHTPSGTITITTGVPGTGETANYTPAGTVSKPTFSGTSATLTTSAANS